MTQLWYRIDKDTNQRELVNEEYVRERVANYVHSVDLAIEAAVDGIPARTPYALYECIQRS